MMKFEIFQEKDKCISYYQTEAKRYDKKRFSCECNKLYDRIFKNIVYKYLENCMYVLDVGCGTGRFAIYLAKRGIDVVAIDRSNEMISIARKKSKRAGCENKIRFVIGDIEYLPFKKEVFDAVCSIHVLIHFVERDKIISEFSMVIKNDGFVVFDVPNKVLSKAYWILMRTLEKTTFRDYHYDIKEVENLFLDNSLKVADQTKIVKVPRLILHFFICILKLKFLVKVIENFEKFNFGATSIVLGMKQ